MGVTKDASSPAVVNTAGGSAATTLTSASFSPPANTVLVAQCEVNYNSFPGSPPTLSVSDSKGGTWTLAGTQLNNSAAFAILATFTRPCSTAPGSMTVTMHRGTDNSAAELALVVTVCDGANVSSPQGAHNTATGTAASVQGTVTTTQSGSLVFASAIVTGSQTYTAEASTTQTLQSDDSVEGGVLLAGYASSVTGTPGTGSPGALGWTSTSGPSWAWSGVEILPGSSGVNVTPTTAVVKVAATAPTPSSGTAGGTTPVTAAVHVVATAPQPTFPASVSPSTAVVTVSAYPPLPTTPSTLPGLPQINDWAVSYTPTATDFNLYIRDAFNFLASPPVLRVEQTSAQSINGNGTVIAYQSVLEDNYSGWNSGTYTYVAPVSGWYAITALVGTNLPGGSSGTLALGYELNGVAYGPIWFTNWSSNGSPWTFSLYEETYLHGGDSVYVSLATTSGSYSTDLTYPSTLEIVWLSR